MGHVVTKSDLVQVAAKAGNLSRAAAGEAVNAVFDAIVENVAKGKRVTVVGFGSTATVVTIIAVFSMAVLLRQTDRSRRYASRPALICAASFEPMPGTYFCLPPTACCLLQ